MPLNPLQVQSQPGGINFLTGERILTPREKAEQELKDIETKLKTFSSTPSTGLEALFGRASLEKQAAEKRQTIALYTPKSYAEIFLPKQPETPKVDVEQEQRLAKLQEIKTKSEQDLASQTALSQEAERKSQNFINQTLSEINTLKSISSVATPQYLENLKNKISESYASQLKKISPKKQEQTSFRNLDFDLEKASDVGSKLGFMGVSGLETQFKASQSNLINVLSNNQIFAKTQLNEYLKNLQPRMGDISLTTYAKPTVKFSGAEALAEISRQYQPSLTSSLQRPQPLMAMSRSVVNRKAQSARLRPELY